MSLSIVPFSVETSSATSAKTSQLQEGGPQFLLDTLIIGDIEEDIGVISAPVIEAGNDRSAEIKRLMQEGQAAFDAGNLRQLRNLLHQILAIDPDYTQAHFNLGVLERDRGAYPEAETHLRKAVKCAPKNTRYYLALGELLYVMRHLLFAAETYEAGLALDPNNLVMLANLTEIRQKQRMPREVAELSRRCLALEPQSTKATETLAWALLWLGETEEAVEAAERVLSLDPKSLPATVMLQIGLNRLGQADRAEEILAEIKRRAIEQWDDCAVITDQYAQFDDRDTAIAILREVIAKRPNFVPAILQLGRYVMLKSDLDEGFKLMSRVVELNPDEGDAQTSVALTLIRNGDFAEGWARHHWRWKRTGSEPKWDLDVPEWDGSDLGDGTLLIWREQGIGDMVMYAAPAIACRALARKVVIETNPRLQPLLQRSFPDMPVICREVVTDDFIEANGITAQCPIGDLPHLLKLGAENYPGRDGFLVPDPTDVERLRSNYRMLFPGKRLIGISWRSGNASSAVTRSVELPQWMPIFETPDCAFISLQYGDISKELELLSSEHGIDVHIDTGVNAMQNMDIFSAQIAALDAVISVDNSTVHVAGALGKKTWVLVPSASDWRWLTPERTDTIWYRSLTLLRQEPGTSWQPKVADAAARLDRLDADTLLEERIDFYLRCARQSIDTGGINVGERYYRLILQSQPDHHAALAGLGRIALGTGHVAEGTSLLRRAIEIEPRNITYQSDLIEAFQVSGRFDQAYATLRAAVALDSQNRRVLTLGIQVLSQLGHNGEVANFCARLLRLEPDNRQARLHLAQIQVDAGDFDVAESNLRRVLVTAPDDAVANYLMGCLAFRREDFQSGWRGFARRFDAWAEPRSRALPLEMLDLSQGVDLAQARIAVTAEPGLKDQILFARWLACLRRESAFISAELDPRLIPLIDQSEARLSLFPAGSLQVEEADDLRLGSQISLGDLGARYAPDVNTISGQVPYLRFEPEKASSLRQQYQSVLQKPKLVGICWRGGDMSLPLREWMPILRQENVGFVALQAGPAQQELHEVFESLGKVAVRDPSIDPQSNLRGFANQIAAVDLVISIDEVPAHLAGALGVPVFCLLPKVAHWRWLGAERNDSPWYPGMRLYRQVNDGIWADVMERVAHDVTALIGVSESGRTSDE